MVAECPLRWACTHASCMQCMLCPAHLLPGAPCGWQPWLPTAGPIPRRSTGYNPSQRTGCPAWLAMQATAPRLLEVLSADMPAEVERLRSVFLGFAAFGAPRGAAPPTELDGVGAQGLQLACSTGSALSALSCQGAMECPRPQAVQTGRCPDLPHVVSDGHD